MKKKKKKIIKPLVKVNLDHYYHDSEAKSIQLLGNYSNI